MNPEPVSFEDAVAGLRRGDFSASAPLFEELRPGDDAPIIRWHQEGRFQNHEDALLEAFSCACFLGRNHVVRFLLARGVRPNGGAGTGCNAVHWAANRGQLDTVKILLAHGADLESQNMYGGTVLGMTVWSAFHEPRPAHLAIIEALLAAGARPEAVSYPTGNDAIDVLLRKYRPDVDPLSGR